MTEPIAARPRTRQSAPRLWLRLRSGSLRRATLALLGICFVVQLLLGASLVVLALAMISCIAGLSGFRIAGAYRSGPWLAFFFVLGNVIVALVAKTAFLQPLDSNLYVPLDSLLVLATGSTVLLIALLISSVFPVGKPIFRSITDPQLLRWLSFSTFCLGTLFWYLTRLFQEPDSSGFGGVAVFWNLVLMAVIARTAMVMELTEGRRSVDTTLLGFIGASVAMGLIDNSKAEVALPIVAYFATGCFYRGGATRRQVVAGALGLLVMVAVVGPMIHAFRGLGIQDMPWHQRATLIERGVRDAFTRRDLGSYQEIASSQFRAGYYDYFGQGVGQMFLGRYASIQQIDPVVATVNRRGLLGGSIVWPAFLRLLPTFIYPSKPRTIESFRLLVYLGIVDPEGGKYPTVPLLAQSYAGYGVAGVLLIPFVVFMAMLLAMKKLGWGLHRNVFAIFFFCVFVLVYANQGDVGQYAEAVLRNFPLLAAVIWLLMRAYRARFRRHYRPAAAVAANAVSLPRSLPAGLNHQSTSDA